MSLKVGVLCALVATTVPVLIGHASSGDTPKPAPTAKAVTLAAKPKVNELAVWQAAHERDLDRIIASAEQVARGDPYAEGVVNTFRQRAVAARVAQDGSYDAFTDRAADIAFPFVFVAKGEEKLLKRRPDSAFSFQGDAFIYLEGESWQSWYLGIVALHEMVHWDDQVLSRRESRSSKGEEWIRGEVHAHTVEFAAIDRLTDNGFSSAIRELINDPKRCVYQAGQPYCWFANGTVSQDLHDAVWPDKPLSPTEASNRHGSFSIALALAQAGSEREKFDAYRWAVSRYATKYRR